MQVLNLLKPSTNTDDDDLFLKNCHLIARFEAFDVIAFAQMNAKHYYDGKHQFLFMKSKDFAFIRLHKNYDISFTAILGSKLNQQYAGSFKILEKIGRLIYRLKLSQHWRIHLVLSVAQLKSTSSKTDPFDRLKSNHPLSMFVEKNTDKIKSYTLKKIIDKRLTARREPEYLIKWKEYDFEEDVWRNLLEMKNAMKLIKKYENLIKNIIYLSEHLKSVTATVFHKKFFAFANLSEFFASFFKISITSSEMIHRNPLMIISTSLKSPPLSLQKVFVSSSLKTSASFRRFSRLSRRFSRLLLSPLWWRIGWMNDMLTKTPTFFLFDEQMLWLSKSSTDIWRSRKLFHGTSADCLRNYSR